MVTAENFLFELWEGEGTRRTRRVSGRRWVAVTFQAVKRRKETGMGYRVQRGGRKQEGDVRKVSWGQDVNVP